MPTDEKPYYNIKRLHVAFAASSLLLLTVTIWMFAVDHKRQWKSYQETYNDRVEPWVTEAKILAAEEEGGENVEQLERTLSKQQPGLGKNVSRLPVIDALGRTLAVEQMYLPELTIDYNFSRVPRIDRCTTCHQGIDLTVPGEPSKPAFTAEKTLKLTLRKSQADGSLKEAYGMALVPRGVIDADDATVGFVLPETPAAFAGLQVGDVIAEIDGKPIVGRDAVQTSLMKGDFQGDSFKLTVQRGLPEPYCAHPRLDLMVGSLSPHPMGEFGCTICHDGQGSATEFRLASHTPNTLKQESTWKDRYDWSRNPHWDFPMLPGRFAESRCLKCHHEVVDLESSRRFLDPPAPKLVAGYHLVRQNGCFGCHEIKGRDATGRSIGPDMRFAPDGTSSVEAIRLGLYRKVGPNLRYSVERMSPEFLTNWIADPTKIRPTTRMPKLFGLYDYLSEQGRAEAKKLEADEIRGIVAYLLAKSESVEPLPPPKGITEKPSLDRGRDVFRMQGCLACHAHAEFPNATATQGPNLSNLGDKYTTDAGIRWLVDWIRDPAHCWPKTLMPNPLLEPAPTNDGGLSDPAADAAEFLLSFKREATVPTGNTQNSGSKDLMQIGRRTIQRRGCFGCHEIPGFENAKPIGPSLTDWGRKQESLLAFEQIDRLVEKTAGQGRGDDDPGRDFFTAALLSHRREGFLWQKLHSPRSFDFGVAEQKPFDKWLTMGQFKFTPAEREQIMTFVLGLVADPPAERFVCSPGRKRRAIIDGQKVMTKYACAECHMLAPQRWSFDFDPKTFEDPPEIENFDFVKPTFTPEQLADSKATDNRGLGHAIVTGMPQVDAEGNLLEDEDDDGNPAYFFTLWNPAAINGKIWPVGGMDLMISAPQLTERRPADGGAFARLLHGMILADPPAGTVVSPREALGWVPPPLGDEGAKVRLAWLHAYLMNPNRIRPAAVLRMPRFSLANDEAARLAEYFAAASDMDFPYDEPAPNQQPDFADRRFDEALRLLVDETTFCAKCHKVGDYVRQSESQTTRAPNLADVQGRLRRDYVRRWIADPRAILPYTAMPVNFPPTGPPLGQDILPGTSLEQIDAVTELLTHFDGFLRSKTSIRAAIDPTPAQP